MQVNLPVHASDSVRITVLLCVLHPMAFEKDILNEHMLHSTMGCLLFDPGTGKTLVIGASAEGTACLQYTLRTSWRRAKPTTNRLGQTVRCGWMKPLDCAWQTLVFERMWEGEKLICSVFSLAPWVVLTNEIDSLHGRGHTILGRIDLLHKRIPHRG